MQGDRMKLGWVAALLLTPALAALAQDATAGNAIDQNTTRHTPVQLGTPHYQSAYDFLYRFSAACGVGASTSQVATKPTLGCGVDGNPLVLVYTEIGVMGPQANRSSVSGYISNDLIVPLFLLARHKPAVQPILLGGYTRMFETGHALDYGVALSVDRPSKDEYNGKTIQFELRDYYTFANPSQHNIIFRIVWLTGVQD
jgi:hypothetical protein